MKIKHRLRVGVQHFLYINQIYLIKGDPREFVAIF